MRLWSSKLLRQELAQGKLTDWEKTKYLLGHLILTSLGGGTIYFFTPRHGIAYALSYQLFTVIGATLMALVTIFGIKLVFKANQQIDGKHFIERYIVLSLPILIKLCLYLIPITLALMVIIGLLLQNFPWLQEKLSRFIAISLFPGIFLCFYWRVAASFRLFGQILVQRENPINLGQRGDEINPVDELAHTLPAAPKAAPGKDIPLKETRAGKPKQKKRIIVTLIFAIVLLLMLTITFLLFRTPEESTQELQWSLEQLPSDRKMLRNFHSNSNTFQYLADQILQDKTRNNLDQVTIEYSGQYLFDDTMRKKMETYRKLMTEIGVIEINAKDPKMIIFKAQTCPRFEKSYLYSLEQLPRFRVRSRLDYGKPAGVTFRDGYSVGRHISGKWFLYLQCHPYHPFSFL